MPELRGGLFLRPVTGVIEKRDVILARLAQVLAESLDDRVASGLFVREHLELEGESLAAVDTLLEIGGEGFDVVDASAQGVHTTRSNPILGTGWGHEYTEVNVAISIKEVFEQYRYIPHNSVLGLLAFSGLLGFGFVWQLFVVCCFFNAISVKAAETSIVRMASILGITGIATYIFQMWGDMGWNTLPADVIMAVAVGVATRVPVLSGAWPEKKASEARSDEHGGEDPERAVDGEGDQRLPEPALGAPSVTRIEERDDDRRPENAEDDELAHG